MQILMTKLFAPPPRAELVDRPRLLEMLDEGARQGVTLLSAPAGFGKTTLVSAWLAARGDLAAWLSLDVADNDPVRFLAHLVAALQTVAPDVGSGVLAALNAPGPVATERLLTGLVNDVAVVPGDLVLVLDDYHVIEEAAVESAVGFLLGHLPPRLHVVFTTREDPNLGLAGLRASGRLTEVRAADLRFTADEAARFLKSAMAMELSAEDIAALEARTEGWIAGLQLAAISMRGRDDASAFIRAFRGDHRHIVDYLVQEVLLRQPERVRSFLLQTSILGRVHGALCDAVTGQEGNAALLDDLERRNLFLVPLDDRRQWYRYHPLFADMLRSHLMHERIGQVPVLHARASAWYEANGFLADAVRHALASKDQERAARLVESAWRDMHTAFQSAAWLSWADALPEAVVRSRPVLCAGYAWAQLNVGKMEAAEAHLREVETWLDSVGSKGEKPDGYLEPTLDDDPEIRALPGTVASARAYHALAIGAAGASVAHARRALELLPPTDHVGRGIPLGILSLAHWANGDLDEAYRILSDAMAGFRATGNVVAAISGTFGLADILAAQGRLRDGIRLYQDSFRLVATPPAAVLPGMSELHVGLGELLLEQGDVGSAAEHLSAAGDLGGEGVLAGDESRLLAAMARIHSGLGKPELALELLDEADRLKVPNPMPELRPLDALRARIWLDQGRLAEAEAWALARELPDQGDLGYAREFEHLVFARLRIAHHRRDRDDDSVAETLALLERLLGAAEAGGRTGSMIEILTLQAVALAEHGEGRMAAAPLARALELAEPEGYVRVFVDEGPTMQVLLRQFAKRGASWQYARRLLPAFADARLESRGATAVAGRSGRHAAHDVGAPPTDALTEREASVLRLLQSDLSGPEIARELRVSLNTLRTHSKNVYGKLGVNSRRAAVRRAEELGLL
ncbi:MAG: LuxR C-terminal-related transcriptional regulator [Trueperaceae bacterium]